MKYMVELEYDTVEKIIITELRDTYNQLDIDYHNRTEGSLAIWEHDVEEDKKAIKKHMKALKLILKYYGVGVDDDEN